MKADHPEEMARPASRRELRRHDRRETIMMVAAESFLKRGYSATTMSGIAAALGGSKGTLWSYFASKEALFEAVLDNATATYRASLSAILDPSGDLTETLRRFCIQIVNKVTSPESVALHRLVMAEAGRFPEMGRIFYDRAPRQTHALLADYLQGAMQRGQIRRDDPMEAARLMVNLCVTGSQQKLLVGLIDTVTPEMVDADVDRALDVFLRAYALAGVA